MRQKWSVLVPLTHKKHTRLTPHLQSEVFQNTCMYSARLPSWPQFAWITSPVVPGAKHSNTFNWKLSPQKSVIPEQSTTLSESEENTVILSIPPVVAIPITCLSYAEICISLPLCCKTAKCVIEGFCQVLKIHDCLSPIWLLSVLVHIYLKLTAQIKSRRRLWIQLIGKKKRGNKRILANHSSGK